MFGRKKNMSDLEKPSLESRGVYADGVAYGVANWLWRTMTTNTLSVWMSPAEGGGGARREGVATARGDAGVAILVAVAAAVATLLLRFDTYDIPRA